MFCNTLTANDKYPVGYCVNLLSPAQMEFSLKPTIFSRFFVPFPESTSNFKEFEEKDDSQTYFIWEIRHCEKVG